MAVAWRMAEVATRERTAQLFSNKAQTLKLEIGKRSSVKNILTLLIRTPNKPSPPYYTLTPNP